jgi:hypothetical protein
MLAWAFFVLMLVAAACCLVSTFYTTMPVGHRRLHLGWLGITFLIISLLLLSGVRHALFY